MSLNFRGHPLVGIWSGVYGEHGSELVFVHEVAGKEGYIFATKLTGDVNVPAGLVSFWLHVGYGSEVITGKGQIAGKGHVDGKLIFATLWILLMFCSIISELGRNALELHFK